MQKKPVLLTVLACLGLLVAAGGTAAAMSWAQFTSRPGNSSPVSSLRNGVADLVLWPTATQPSSYRVFTASGSFTVPSGVTRMILEVRGGGGGGGIGASGGNGSGGGQGGWERVLVTVKAGAVFVVTVGKGGSGGTTGRGGTGGDSTVHLRGRSELTARVTGGGGGFPGESCDAASHNGPVPGGASGAFLPPSDAASTGLNAEAAFAGGPSSYLPPVCPSTPIGGNGGGRGFAGAGGEGGPGASSGSGAKGHAGLVLVAFLR